MLEALAAAVTALVVTVIEKDTGLVWEGQRPCKNALQVSVDEKLGRIYLKNVGRHGMNQVWIHPTDTDFVGFVGLIGIAPGHRNAMINRDNIRKGLGGTEVWQGSVTDLTVQWMVVSGDNKAPCYVRATKPKPGRQQLAP